MPLVARRRRLRTDLREETGELHQALESRLDLASGRLTLERYRRVLVGLHGYHAAIEPRLSALAGEVNPPLPMIDRTHLLEDDLRFLGVADAELGAAPCCAVLPALQAREHLAGCVYVLEGARLGGKVIAGSVERHLGLARGRGCSFFAGDGDRTAARWAAVLGWLDELADEPAADHRAIIASAAATFRTLGDWLAARGALA